VCEEDSFACLGLKMWGLYGFLSRC
jgi:hypothetical protein